MIRSWPTVGRDGVRSGQCCDSVFRSESPTVAFSSCTRSIRKGGTTHLRLKRRPPLTRRGTTSPRLSTPFRASIRWSSASRTNAPILRRSGPSIRIPALSMRSPRSVRTRPNERSALRSARPPRARRRIVAGPGGSPWRPCFLGRPYWPYFTDRRTRRGQP